MRAVHSMDAVDVHSCLELINSFLFILMSKDTTVDEHSRVEGFDPVTHTTPSTGEPWCTMLPQSRGMRTKHHYVKPCGDSTKHGENER